MIQKVPCLNSFCLSEKDRGGEKGRGGGEGSFKGWDNDKRPSSAYFPFDSNWIQKKF